jgi:hypothetical protein
MTTLITGSTIKAALRDQRQGQRYDVSDSRVSGLQLRVKPQSVRWSLRARLHGNQRRYDLGPVVEGDEDIDGLSLQTARARAMRVSEMVRRGQNPDTFLTSIAAGVSIETQLKREAARPKPSWTWEAAKDAFLAEVKRSCREDTHRDYRGKLLPRELARFDGRQVNTITRNEMAAAIGEVHGRGAEAYSPKAATSTPGSDWCPSRSRRETARSSAKSRGAAIATCAFCSCRRHGLCWSG